MATPSKGVVLIADGEASVRDVLHFYLKRSGYQVIQVEDGQDAIVEMSKVKPDMILADLALPQISGDALCKVIKRNPDTKNIYFILMTPPTDIVDIETTIDALSIGADDTITKPLRSQELLARVGSAFRIIAMQKEITQQNRELLAYRENIQRDIELAAQLQTNLMPEIGSLPPYRYTHRIQPAHGISGDIYSIVPLPYGGVALMIADASGHGVTAALITAIIKTSFENHLRARSGPATWAQGMSRDLMRNTLEEQYATAVLAKLDPMSGTLTYVCAGHEPPIYIQGGATTNPKPPTNLSGTGQPLGMGVDVPYTEHTIDFKPDDRLVLYTDGLTEAESEARIPFGNDGLVKACAALPSALEEAVELLFTQAQEHVTPNKFIDDVALVVLDHQAD
jgi:sigma-B regulation protein RsbU (phosphoserine phosphatase)